MILKINFQENQLTSYWMERQKVRNSWLSLYKWIKRLWNYKELIRFMFIRRKNQIIRSRVKFIRIKKGIGIAYITIIIR